MGECLLYQVLREAIDLEYRLWRCWRSGFLEVESQIQWALLHMDLRTTVMVP